MLSHNVQADYINVETSMTISVLTHLTNTAGWLGGGGGGEGGRERERECVLTA